MKILIVCDPEESKATEVCLFLKMEAERMNRRVVVLNARDLSRSPGDFDAIILATEFLREKDNDVMRVFLLRHNVPLHDIPSFFLPIYSCIDENDLKVPRDFENTVSIFLKETLWNPQQVLPLPVGVKVQGDRFVTSTMWPELKIALQRFLIRNDVMMVR